MRFSLLMLLFAVAVAGCGNSQPVTSMDLSVPHDLSFTSRCGHPGDVGNSIGVGKFCLHQSDCLAGTVCTQLGDPNEYFCTKSPCDPGDAGLAECGEHAHCGCDPMGRGCGCVPDSCP